MSTARPRQVCVLGSGAAGLGAAWQLERAGHHTIVLETLDDVGGRAWGGPAEHAGQGYDLGGQRNPPQSHRLGRLAAELGVAVEPAPPTRTLDTGTGATEGRAGSLRRAIAAYLPLRQRVFPRIGEPGLAHSARALADPASRWLAEHELSTVADVVGPGYTASGHGRPDDDLPALYYAKYIETTGFLSTLPPALGHPHGFVVTGGVQRLWDSLAAGLSDVRCGVRIERIVRAGSGVTVYTDAATFEADELVVALSFNEAIRYLDASDEERDIAARVRYVKFCAVLCTISGLPANIADATVPAVTTAAPGQCVGLQRLSPGRDEFACYCYGADDLPTEDIVSTLGKDLEQFGGRLEQVHAVRRRRRVPHFGGADIRDGIYDRIEDLQGQRHTYLTGALPAFSLVESSLAYSQDLIDRFFGGSASAVDGPAGAAPPVAHVPHTTPSAVEVSPAALRGWLVNHIAELTDRQAEQVDPHDALDSFGLHSLSAVAMVSELSEWLGRKLDPSILFEFPTIEALVSHLSSSEGGSATASPGRTSELLFRMTAGRPFFCLPGSHGTAYYLLPLAREVGSARPFHGLHTPGHDGAEQPLRTVPSLAARQLEEIRRVQPHGPYLLGGHSFGGIVAYEIARQLREAGEEVTRVVLLDTCLRRLPAAPPSNDGPPEENWLESYLGGDAAMRVEEQAEAMAKVSRACDEACLSYQTPPSDLDVVLFRAADPDRWTGGQKAMLRTDEPAGGWEHVELGNLQVVQVAGDHRTMLFQPNSAALATALRACLAEVPPTELHRRSSDHGN